MSSRTLTLLLAGGLALVLLVGGLFVAVPYVALGPGPDVQHARRGGRHAGHRHLRP